MPTSTETVVKPYGTSPSWRTAALLINPMERELTLRAIRKALAATTATSGPSAKTTTKAYRRNSRRAGQAKVAFLLDDQGYQVNLIDQV
ncbi:hypothetical protein N657DRAFT_648080, partial [Parathielavia appendiculata]